MVDYEGESSVTVRFVYDDEGTWAEGVAIDNVGLNGTLLANSGITVSTPVVEDAFVLQGTQNHVLYKMDLTVVDANTTFSDLVFTTAGTYDNDDLVANSFRLWYSTDDILSAGDAELGIYDAVTSGSQLIFNCVSRPINAGTIGYLFLTVDIDAAGTVGNTVFVTAPDIATGVIFLSGDVTGATVAGGVQTIALPNTLPTSEDNRVETVKNVAYTFATTDFVFTDVDATDVLAQVSISSINLPSGATLTLGGTPVTQGTLIDAAQIGSLVFTPATDGIGDNYASFTFRVSDGRDFSDLLYNMIVDVVSDEIFVPSLFSPNNDGANETFVLLGANGNIGRINLKIFDRNNNLVFETSDITRATQTGWDGTNDGTEQPAGAYIWLIEGTYSNGDPLEFEGKTTGIIRMIR
jgi:gliding motility-associated-like protein